MPMAPTRYRRPWRAGGFVAPRPISYGWSRSRAARQSKFAAMRAGSSGQRVPMYATPTGVGMPRSSVEVKCFDLIVNNGAQATLGLIGAVAFTEPNVALANGYTHLVLPIQGATVYNRVGNKVNVKSIRIRCTLCAGASANPCTVRTLVVYDRQANGAAPAIATILADANTGATTAVSDINIANRNRFYVIRDQIHALDMALCFTKNIDLYAKGNWPMEFSASAGNIGDITTGSFLFIVYTVNVFGAGPTYPNISNLHCRARYLD